MSTTASAIRPHLRLDSTTSQRDDGTSELIHFHGGQTLVRPWLGGHCTTNFSNALKCCGSVLGFASLLGYLLVLGHGLGLSSASVHSLATKSLHSLCPRPLYTIIRMDEMNDDDDDEMMIGEEVVP